MEDVSFEDKKTKIPVWLLLSYIVLLSWSVWNLIRYWD